ncbi:hypothetical protein B0T11DRAFT_338282 [Plectosphaerella cucumerina]|uniref:Protein kinase domain-containing protein n=1 Tax=Plectosphaerella cucumerina TaxID=40658 RepID=A0A8K0TLX7_9PEZI|nr:hypothetical protein B0T11DRAFT_338282 [Plectosphaerella cucumerina]
MASSSSSHLGFESLYPPSAIIQLRSHTPPQPFGDGWYKPPFNRDPTYQDPQIIAQSTPDDFVFSKMPRDRDTDSFIPPFAQAYFGSSAQEHEASLRIIKGLATGTEKGSQVFLCEVQASPSEYWKAMGYNEFPKKVIAKIFDPLYYPTISPLAGQHLDIVSWADKMYAHEAGAYIEIQGHRRDHPVIDDMTPNFFGTFSITHQDHESRLRHVRVVLVEYIEGTPLTQLCTVQSRRRSSDFLKPIEQVAGGMEERLQIFGRMLHGLVALEKIGVYHQDADPSNILVLGKQGDLKRRVVITDFNDSRILRYTKRPLSLSMELPRPLHPRWRFGIQGFSRGDDDSDTDSDDEEEEDNEGAGPCFTKWAMRAFPEADFVGADEADEVAERRIKARALESEETTETTKVQSV